MQYGGRAGDEIGMWYHVPTCAENSTYYVSADIGAKDTQVAQLAQGSSSTSRSLSCPTGINSLSSDKQTVIENLRFMVGQAKGRTFWPVVFTRRT